MSPMRRFSVFVVMLAFAIVIQSAWVGPAEAQKSAEQKAVEKAAKDLAKAQKTAQKNAEKQAKEVAKAAEKAAVADRNSKQATLLRQAWLLVNAANGEYAGHRNKAKARLTAAINRLDKGILDSGDKSKEADAARQEAIRAYYKSLRAELPTSVEPQLVSVAQIYQAGQLLGQVRGTFTDSKQASVLKDVDSAIDELRLCLEQRAKDLIVTERNLTEANFLRQAYILLDTANAVYDGHRAAAMNHVNAGIDRLDRAILRKGENTQFVADLRQEAIQAYYKAVRKEVPVVIEPQLISDAQVYQAGQLLAQVRPIFVANNQSSIVERIDEALREIAVCVTIK